MNSLLLEQIDNADLIKDGKVNINAVHRLTPMDIIEFAHQSAELTSAENLSRETELFTNSASLSLGGSAWPCAEIRCRLNKAHQIAQFSAFYSDKVYIHNFLTDHLKHLESEEYPDERLMLQKLIGDLEVLQALRPLIESERIVVISPRFYCPHCFVETILKQQDDKRLVKGLEKIILRYNTEPKYSAYLDKGGAWNLQIIGPEDLFEHGYLAYVHRKMPRCFRVIPRLRKRILKGDKVTLSQEVVEKMQIDLQLADHVFQNAIFALTASQCLNTVFVTERELDISFINDITNNANIKCRNQIVREHLTCLVPFIKNVTVDDILKIRKNEEEAFISFRQVLNNAIDQSLASKNKFTEQTAYDIYQDLIRPELAALDQKIRKAHKAILKRTGLRATVWAAGLAFGLYTGILPDALVEAATVLGLTKVLADMAGEVVSGLSSEKTIQCSGMYFLWKVKQRASKKFSKSVVRQW